MNQAPRLGWTGSMRGGDVLEIMLLQVCEPWNKESKPARLALVTEAKGETPKSCPGYQTLQAPAANGPNF